MSAKELERALREGGQKVSHGRIRIDSARALQRLRDFRFAEPAHWVLEVLRAAVLSGANSVRVRTDADDVEVSFDGRPFPRESMKHLLEQALNPGKTDDEKRTRLLALGAAGALGVGARFVKIQSGGISLTLQDERVEVEETPGSGTHFHLRKAFGWRVTAAFFRGSPEGLAITERALRFPAKLTLNGRPFVQGSSKRQPTRLVTEAGWRLEIFVPQGPPDLLSDLAIDVAGVLVARRKVELPGLQLRAWLRADGVRRNASGSDVVDDDEQLRAALKALRVASRELIGVMGKDLAEDEAWRTAFLQLLVSPDLEGEVKKELYRLPLVPGPAGERWTLEELHEAVRKDSRLLVAKRPWPKGSYPTPTVLLEGFTGVAKLLPVGKRVDVEDLVRQKARVAYNRERFAQLPVELPQLAHRPWVARATIDGLAVTGEVGFEPSGNGAFVRVLHQGRLMSSGELTSLSPLRLRAVVDWTRPLSDSFFDDEGAPMLLGMVAKHVETAATKAVCDALEKPEVLPHALDLLTRLVVHRDASPKELPPALLAAPLFPCLGGEPVPLETLQGEPRWRFVTSRRPHGLLDGARVLVLPPPQYEILKKLAPQRLESVALQLTHEQDVRRRLAGPKEEARVTGVVAKVAVEGEGLQGEVGVPVTTGARLELTLLKDGLVLETTELAARYRHAVAVVDCPALAPNAKWTGATRDAAFRAVTLAVDQAQRRLAAELVQVPREDWPGGADLFFLTFLEKELVGFEVAKLDDVGRAVVQAPLFHGAHGRRSLLELQEQVRRDGRLLVLSPLDGRPAVPEGFELLFEPPDFVEVLAEVLGAAPEDASQELMKLDARRQLESSPVVKFELPRGVALETRVVTERFVALAGLRDGFAEYAAVQVLIGGRAYCSLTVPCALRLTVLLDAPTFEPARTRELTDAQRQEVDRLVEGALQAVLHRALELRDDADARRALLLALGQGLDRGLPEADAEALQTRDLFPCTDGRVRSCRTLDREGPQFVTAAMEGALPNRRPIVVADEPVLRLAMRRWPKAEEVDAELRAQLEALRVREAVAAVERVVSRVESPWRQRLDEGGLSGEVVVAREGAGRLELFLDRKPLCVLEGALPLPLAGAVDSPRLTPKPGFSGVVEDEHLKEVVDALAVAGARLGAQLASAPRLPEWEAPLVCLAFQVAAATAWEWKGQKKPRGKKKAKKSAVASRSVDHPLLAAPLLRSSDGSALSVRELLSFQLANSRVEVTKEGGRFLEPGRRAWWPRMDEDDWATPLGLVLDDVTADLQFAESLRQRPRFEEVRAPLASAWREPVHGPSLEGEVVLGPLPDGAFSIEVLHERMLLERWSSAHPVGGVARVDSKALTPDERWTQAKRDASFKALVSATEAALERLLVRRLTRSPADLAFRAWAAAAVRWRAGHAGPLAALVPSLALFTDLAGAPVTVGEVMDLATRQGRVPLSQPLGAGDTVDTLVLLDTADTRATLSTLRLKFEDVSGDLRRAKDLQRALATRRLGTLSWKGEALVKIQVASGPLTGELALASAPGQGGVLLARDGISIEPLGDAWPGVVGVIDVKDLQVNDDWTTGQPSRVQRSLIRVQVERLFTALAEAAPSFAEREREVAATWALRFLSDSGVESPAHLERLTGAAQALTDAPLFSTVEGEKVNVRAVAAEVGWREKVAVLLRSAGVQGGSVSCVLATSAWDAPWLAALEDLFGRTKVWRVTELDEWARAVREADPPEGTPELQGLRVLRREVRLLRAGALGPLTPDDLEDVRLSRAGGGTPLRYDRARKLALLDPEHPDVARALKEAQHRPERIWVLLAALFGLVNRELLHVTDEHEARLLMALAGHLASNPKLLG